LLFYQRFKIFQCIVSRVSLRTVFTLFVLFVYFLNFILRVTAGAFDTSVHIPGCLTWLDFRDIVHRKLFVLLAFFSAEAKTLLPLCLVVAWKSIARLLTYLPYCV